VVCLLPGGVLFTLMGGWMLLASHSRVADRLMGCLLLAWGAVTLYLLGRVLLSSAPAVTLDARGLTVKGPLMKAQRVAWDEVREIRWSGGRNGIALEARDPDALRARRSAFARTMHWLVPAADTTAVSVAPAFVGMDADRLMDLLRHWHQRHGRRNERLKETSR
jgi:hypothetical protein